MDDYPSQRRDRIEDAIAKLLDVRDVLADEARREDKRARDRFLVARKRLDAPVRHTQSDPATRQRRRA